MATQGFRECKRALWTQFQSYSFVDAAADAEKPVKVIREPEFRSLLSSFAREDNFERFFSGVDDTIVIQRAVAQLNLDATIVKLWSSMVGGSRAVADGASRAQAAAAAAASVPSQGSRDAFSANVAGRTYSMEAVPVPPRTVDWATLLATLLTYMVDVLQLTLDPVEVNRCRLRLRVHARSSAVKRTSALADTPTTPVRMSIAVDADSYSPDKDPAGTPGAGAAPCEEWPSPNAAPLVRPELLHQALDRRPLQRLLEGGLRAMPGGEPASPARPPPTVTSTSAAAHARSHRLDEGDDGTALDVSRNAPRAPDADAASSTDNSRESPTAGRRTIEIAVEPEEGDDDEDGQGGGSNANANGCTATGAPQADDTREPMPSTATPLPAPQPRRARRHGAVSPQKCRTTRAGTPTKATVGRPQTPRRTSPCYAPPPAAAGTAGHELAKAAPPPQRKYTQCEAAVGSRQRSASGGVRGHRGVPTATAEMVRGPAGPHSPRKLAPALRTGSPSSGTWEQSPVTVSPLSTVSGGESPSSARAAPAAGPKPRRQGLQPRAPSEANASAGAVGGPHADALKASVQLSCGGTAQVIIRTRGTAADAPVLSPQRLRKKPKAAARVADSGVGVSDRASPSASAAAPVVVRAANAADAAVHAEKARGVSRHTAEQEEEQEEEVQEPQGRRTTALPLDGSDATRSQGAGVATAEVGDFDVNALTAKPSSADGQRRSPHGAGSSTDGSEAEVLPPTALSRARTRVDCAAVSDAVAAAIVGCPSPRTRTADGDGENLRPLLPPATREIPRGIEPPAQRPQHVFRRTATAPSPSVTPPPLDTREAEPPVQLPPPTVRELEPRTPDSPAVAAVGSSPREPRAPPPVQRPASARGAETRPVLNSPRRQPAEVALAPPPQLRRTVLLSCSPFSARATALEASPVDAAPARGGPRHRPADADDASTPARPNERAEEAMHTPPAQVRRRSSPVSSGGHTAADERPPRSCVSSGERGRQQQQQQQHIDAAFYTLHNSSRTPEKQTLPRSADSCAPLSLSSSPPKSTLLQYQRGSGRRPLDSLNASPQSALRPSDSPRATPTTPPPSLTSPPPRLSRRARQLSRSVSRHAGRGEADATRNDGACALFASPPKVPLTRCRSISCGADRMTQVTVLLSPRRCAERSALSSNTPYGDESGTGG